MNNSQHCEFDEAKHNTSAPPERRGRRKRANKGKSDNAVGHKGSQSFILPGNVLGEQLATISDMPGQMESSSHLAGTEKAADDASHDALPIELAGSEQRPSAHLKRQRKSTISEALLKMEPLSVSTRRVKYPIASTKAQPKKKRLEATVSSNRSTGRVKADLTPSKKSSKKSSIPATKDAKVPEVLSFEGEKEEQSVEGPAAEAPRPTLQEYYNQIIESKSLEQSETMAGQKEAPSLATLSDNDVRLNTLATPAPEPLEDKSRNPKSAQVMHDDSTSSPSVTAKQPQQQQFENSERANAINSSRWSRGGASAFKGESVGELKLEIGRLQNKILLLNQQAKGQAETEARVGQLRKKNKEAEEEIQALKKENMALKLEASQVKGENELLKSNASTLQSTIESLTEKSARQEQELDEAQEARQELNRDFDEINEKLTSMEVELYEAKQSQLELMQQCQDLDNELSTAHRVYVPKRGDVIDQELGRFLNTYPEREKMQILFLRESEGVYQFGSRRVYVKVEKGNQVLVRVGGGFMHIEDFVQQYTPEETDKRGRNDPGARFRRKLSVQRISRRQSVTARESSPIAVPQRPPALAGSPKFTPVLKRTIYKEGSPVAKKKPATAKNRKTGPSASMAKAPGQKKAPEAFVF